MNRRGFIGGLAAMGTGLVVPWELQRVYSFPSSNYIEAVRLTNAIEERGLIHNAQWDSQFLETQTWSRKMFDEMRSLLKHGGHFKFEGRVVQPWLGILTHKECEEVARIRREMMNYSYAPLKTGTLRATPIGKWGWGYRVWI